MPREGGRSCGCDPRANYICESHAAHVDTNEILFAGAGGDAVAVSGPDQQGRFMIGAFYHGAGCRFVQVDRFVVEDIIEELERRLKERA